MRSSRFAALLLLSCSILATGVASAQGEGAAAAEVLFNQGREAMERKDYDAACQRFRESEQIDPAPGTKLNLADCEEKRGRLATAWELFRAVPRDLPESDERHGIAMARAAALEKRLPTLTLRLAAGAPATTKVRVGTAAIGSGSFGVALPLDPGKHSLVIEAPGHAPRTIEIELVEGQPQTLDVVPGTATAVPGPPPDVADTPARPAPSSGKKTLGYVFGGIGLVGVAVGSVAGVIVLSKKGTANEECDDAAQRCHPRGVDANDSGSAIAPISTAGFIVGALGIGAGAYLILTADSKSETALHVGTHSGVSQVSLVRHW
jgi:hypothetical protein